MYWNNAAPDLNQIAWFDRAGKFLGSISHGSFPSISPDEKAIAFNRTAATGMSDLWKWDLVRGTDTRLTSDASRNNEPFWSPHGDRIVFRSERNNANGNLYERATNGSEQDELLVKTPNNKLLSQWSRDGQFIVYAENDRKTGWDIWMLPVRDDGKPRGMPTPFLQTEFGEFQGQLSPNGRWMAYVSDESSQREVYVRPFPVSDGKWKVSTGGGVQPRWRGDGNELFFVTPEGKMMAVPVKAIAGPKPSFEPGTPVALFDAHLDTAGLAVRYDVTLDGTRFFVETIAASSPARLTVWANWITGLKK
jgi:eukaryotic-like serine/threonine-protein kinase